MKYLIVLITLFSILITCDRVSDSMNNENKIQSTVNITIEGYYTKGIFKKLYPVLAPFYTSKIYKVIIQNNTKFDIYLGYIKKSNSISFETIQTMQLINDSLESLTFGIGSDANKDYKLIKKGTNSFVYIESSWENNATHIEVPFRYCKDSISNNFIIQKDTISVINLLQLNE